jgi:hypothetical protein
MTPKRLALGLLAVISFVSPLVETLATGRVESFGNFALGETLVSLVVLFWWYHLDKQERDYPAGRLMNAGVLVAAVIALPIYFIRSRGWRRGAIASALGAAFVGASFLLGELGEWLAAALAS